MSKALLFLALAAAVGCTSAVDDTGGDSASAVSAGAPKTVDAALHNFQRNSGGGRGLSLDVGVGGVTKPLVVDTGSAGIHILTDDIDKAKFVRTGKKIVETYVDGTSLVGEEALAVATIGGVDTVSPIAVHLVDEVTCAPSRPNCGNGGTKEDPHGLRFFHATGISGLVGIGISNANAEPSVYSPLAQLPGNLSSGYIVQTTGYAGETGKLTIGLTDTMRTTFKTQQKLAPQANKLPNGTAAWEDAKVTVCYSLEGTDIQNECVVSIIDTGATAFFWNTKKLGTDNLDQYGNLAEGHTLTANLPGIDGGWVIKVGKNPVPGVDMVISSPGGWNTNLGIGAYFAFDVISDVEKGQIGARKPMLARAR